MATDSTRTQAPQKPRSLTQKLTTWLLTLPFRIAAVLLFAMFSSIILEWVGIYFDWWDRPGGGHAAAVLASEVGWIDTQFTRSLLVSDPTRMAVAIVTGVYNTVFVASGIVPWLSAQAGNAPWLATVAEYGQAAIDVSLVVLVRAIILVLTAPLFAMAAVVGVVDGLVRRDLRRFGAGRESAFIYHHAKRLTGPVFITGWVIYIGLPWSIHPNVFLLPCAALFGLLLSITAGSFKKYL